MKYLLIFVIILFVGIFASLLSTKALYSCYKKANNEIANINLTSANLLAFFIQKLNLNIKIAKYSYGLDNSYSIKKKVIFLSNDVFDSRSVAGISIAMHELGHSIQHHTKTKLFKLYSFFSIIAKITSLLLLPLIIFFLVSLFLDTFYLKLALILFIVLYLINLTIRILIIPLEKNASNIAIGLLREYKIFDQDELKLAKKLLNRAFLTYVGGFFNVYIKFFKKILKSF